MPNLNHTIRRIRHEGHIYPVPHHADYPCPTCRQPANLRCINAAGQPVRWQHRTRTNPDRRYTLRQNGVLVK